MELSCLTFSFTPARHCLLFGIVRCTLCGSGHEWRRSTDWPALAVAGLWRGQPPCKRKRSPTRCSGPNRLMGFFLSPHALRVRARNRLSSNR